MALGYTWFDSYDSFGYVLTLHISPHTVCPYLPIAKRAFFFCIAELLAQQAKSVLALLAPKDVTETRLRVGRVS